jgi:predicted ATPase
MYYFENFKSFTQVKLSLFESKFTLLIGANGSGKSNLLEAIKLLSFLLNGGWLHEVSDLNKGGKLEIRGGIQGCTRYGETAFSLGFSAHTELDGKQQDFDYRLTIDTQTSPRIIREYLYVGNTKYFDINTEKQSSPTRSFLSQNIPNNNIIKNIINDLQKILVFDPNPKLMRNYEHIGNTHLSPNCSNLSAVLYALSQGDKESQQSLQRLLKWIAQLPNEPYQRFDFVTVPKLNDVMLALVESGTDKFISAGVLSDGTLRCLAILTALETATPGSQIIVEEFDNGLYPSRVGIMVNAIIDCCQRRELKVLVTTHNQATLNVLTKEQLEGVILSSHNPLDHSTSLIAWHDLPYQQDMLERGSLGDLVTNKLIDQYLSPDFEDKRKQKALAWLADF